MFDLEQLLEKKVDGYETLFPEIANNVLHVLHETSGEAKLTKDKKVRENPRYYSETRFSHCVGVANISEQLFMMYYDAYAFPTEKNGQYERIETILSDLQSDGSDTLIIPFDTTSFNINHVKEHMTAADINIIKLIESRNAYYLPYILGLLHDMYKFQKNSVDMKHGKMASDHLQMYFHMRGVRREALIDTIASEALEFHSYDYTFDNLLYKILSDADMLVRLTYPEIAWRYGTSYNDIEKGLEETCKEIGEYEPKLFINIFNNARRVLLRDIEDYNHSNQLIGMLHEGVHNLEKNSKKSQKKSSKKEKKSTGKNKNKNKEKWSRKELLKKAKAGVDPKKLSDEAKKAMDTIPNMHAEYNHMMKKSKKMKK